VVVVFGSINLDLCARVPRLPRPGETLGGLSFEATPGGKGANQALAARRGGAEVAMFGAVGRDTFASAALALLRPSGAKLDGVIETTAPTGVALIHVEESGENAITVVPGANALVRAEQVPDDALGPETTLVMQLEVPLGEVAALARRAHERGGRVVLNAAPMQPFDPRMLSDLTVLVANENEAQSLAPRLELPAEPSSFALELAERHRIAVVVTLGSEGAIAAAKRTLHRVPPLAVDCVDTVGAGDAFVGVMAAALDRGASLPAALSHGAAAGALACTRAGAQAALPDVREIADGARELESRLQAITF
jgi:ribokinase